MTSLSTPLDQISMIMISTGQEVNSRQSIQLFRALDGHQDISYQIPFLELEGVKIGGVEADDCYPLDSQSRYYHAKRTLMEEMRLHLEDILYEYFEPSATLFFKEGIVDPVYFRLSLPTPFNLLSITQVIRPQEFFQAYAEYHAAQCPNFDHEERYQLESAFWNRGWQDHFKRVH